MRDIELSGTQVGERLSICMYSYKQKISMRIGEERKFTKHILTNDILINQF